MEGADIFSLKRIVSLESRLTELELFTGVTEMTSGEMLSVLGSPIVDFSHPAINNRPAIMTNPESAGRIMVCAFIVYSSGVNKL